MLPLGVGAEVVHDGTDHSDGVGLCRFGWLGPRVMTFHDGNWEPMQTCKTLSEITVFHLL